MAADNGLKLQVEGLKEFRAGLKKFAPDVAKGLARQYQQIAQMVATKANERADAQGGISAHAARNGAVTAIASATQVAVRLNANKEPTAFAAEFGMKRFTKHPHLGKRGYSLYPTIRAEADGIVDSFLTVVDEAAKSAFPDHT